MKFSLNQNNQLLIGNLHKSLKLCMFGHLSYIWQYLIERKQIYFNYIYAEKVKIENNEFHVLLSTN